MRIHIVWALSFDIKAGPIIAPYNPSSLTPEECPCHHLIPTSEAIKEYVKVDFDSIPH